MYISWLIIYIASEKEHVTCINAQEIDERVKAIVLVYNYSGNGLEPKPFDNLYDCLSKKGTPLFCIGINRR